MAEMTPRERVWASVSHQEPDRVPLDIGGGSSTSIVVEGYERLKRRWGVPGETRIINKIFRVACLDERVMQRLSSDCRPLGIKPPANWTPPPAELGTFFHSCGNAFELIDDMVEVGVDNINPVQVSAMGDTSEPQARFGDRVTFWGAIDTQRILPHGTVDEVEAKVRQRIHDLAPGGGYVVGPVHNIQPDVPPENIVAMAAATRKYGTYPLSV